MKRCYCEGINQPTVYQAYVKWTTANIQPESGAFKLAFYGNTEIETIQWLENNGGIYKNTLHNFQFTVEPKS